MLTTIGLANAQQKTVTLSGTLTNFGNAVRVVDISEYGRLIPPSEGTTIIPDSSGNFKTQIKLSKPGYYLIGHNNLYLSPGDNLVMHIDVKKQETNSTFSGKGKEANTYLRGTLYPAAGSFLWGGSKFGATPQATLDTILTAANKRKAELNALTNVTPEFKRLENARIKADVLVSIWTAPVYTQYTKYFRKESTARQDSFIRAFKELTAPMVTEYKKGFLDVSLLQLTACRGIVEDVAKEAPNSQQVLQIKDLQKANKLVSKMLAEHDKTKLALFKTSIDSIQTLSYRQPLQRYFKELSAFGNGDPAVDFKTKDINGKNVALSDFKGKVIFVDLWATWCGPCMAEMPHYEELKKKYADNPNVVFVSLSIDANYELEKWKKSVAARKADGNQWQISSDKLDAYHVIQIPRVLLITKDFKVADMDGPNPSSKNVVSTIDKLLEK